MKYTILIMFFFTACTVSNSMLDQSAKFKVGDNFSTDSKFYLGSGVLRVTRVMYTECSGKLQWGYLGTLQTNTGQMVDDVEVCESELR